MTYQLGIIGAGNMAEAIVRSVITHGFLPASEIIAADPSALRRQAMQETTAIECTADNAAAAECPTLLIAVKPQMMQQVLGEIASLVDADSLVISIAAGVATANFDAMLGGRGRIVRVMPNTPMIVGEGMSAIAAGPRATKADVDYTSKLFAAGGLTCVVEESMMDAVTAVSGSGPAYFFYLVEAMISAGVAEGLLRSTAEQLAAQTCLGAARMLLATSEKPETLRARVTSPGGTTKSAIDTLELAGVKDAMIAAVRAAAARSRELGR